MAVKTESHSCTHTLNSVVSNSCRSSTVFPHTMPPQISTIEERSAASVGRKRKQTQDYKKVKKAKVDDGKVAEVKKLSRNDLEQLVLNKIVEVITAKSKFGDLAKKFQKMSGDYSKVKEKASALQKQLADLQEVTKRIKVLEETKTVRIPKITRSVGLQVTSKSKAEIEKEEKKAAVIEIENDENSSDAPKSKSSTVEEIIKNDPLNLLKQTRNKKVEVAKKSTGGKNSRQSEIKPLDDDTNEPLSLNVKKSSGTDGIVITWAKKLDKFDLDSVVNYELEGSKGALGGKNLKWSRIGNVIKPLALPMACNLNNFKTGVHYNFRVKLLTRDKDMMFYSNISSIIL